MESLNRHLPDQHQDEHEGASRHGPAQQAERLLESQRGAFHVPALEGQFAELALDLGSGQLAFRQPGGLLEQFRGGIVAPPQHQHVAQPFGDSVLRGPIGRLARRARQCDTAARPLPGNAGIAPAGPPAGRSSRARSLWPAASK